MRRLATALFIVSLAILVLLLPQPKAALKNDGLSQGGSLNYGEYGRPATLDPITSNDMISLRISELIFNGLVGIDEKQHGERVAVRMPRGRSIFFSQHRHYAFRFHTGIIAYPAEAGIYILDFPPFTVLKCLVSLCI